MRLAKRMAAVALSAAMLVSGLYVGQPASAQTPYETKKVYISTDLVPEDENISVAQSDGTSVITARSNVKFTLDCNVDCTWAIDEYGTKQADKVELAKTKITIDAFGVVTVQAGTPEGTYTIAATGKNIKNDKKKATCDIKVKAEDPVTGAVVLDKESIEAQFDDYDMAIDNTPVVNVAENGKSLTVNGHVENMRLYTTVSPEYLADDTVGFVSASTEQAKITSGNRLTTLAATSENGITLDTTCGGRPSSSVKLIVKERDYKARVNCDDIRVTDKDSEKNQYTIRLNEDINFKITDNAPYALDLVDVDHVKWEMRYGTDEAIGLTQDAAGNGEVSTKVGKFLFYNNGRKVNLVTPFKDESSQEYKDYIQQIESAAAAKEITMDAKVYGKDGKKIFDLPRIILNFTKDENNFSTISMDFAQAGLIEGLDYSVKSEKIGNEQKDVYYFEAGETGQENILDLAEATKSDFSGVRDFKESKYKNFQDDCKYMIKYYLKELTEVDKIYRNEDLLDASKNTEINEANKFVTTPGKTLTKQGIGYFRLAVEMTGKNEAKTDCIIRFVSSAENLTMRHTDNYDVTDQEYYNRAVIHIRQGEADIPAVYLNDEVFTLKLTDPFLEFEITDTIKGTKGKVAKPYTGTDGSVKINGLQEGKVVVTATSVVDLTESVSYILYVNDETFQLTKDQLEIDTTDAEKLQRITPSGVVEGHWTDIPLKVRVNNAPNAGVPEVKWSIIGDDAGEFASIDEETGILTTMKSTGNSYITVRATTLYDPEVYAEKRIEIKDVYITKILELGEKVDAGKEAIMTDVKTNAGTAKVGQQFMLESKEHEPKNATSLNGSITWSSSDENIATVNAEGKVTTLAEGAVKIEAKYSSNTANETTTFNLTVKGFHEQVTGISCVDQIVLTRVDDKQTLTVKVLPESVSNKAVRFEVVEGKDIVSVTEAGVVTALKAGTATIKVTSELTPSVSKTVSVTVKGENDRTPGNATPTMAPPSAQPPVQQTPVADVPAKNSKVTNGGSTYVVTNPSASKGEVALSKAKNAKSVKVPDTVTVSGKKYKVTSIKANAFKGSKKLTSVTIGKNVKSIGKNAFNGCKKLTKVTVMSTVLKSIGAKAFAKGSKKITVTVPKKKAKAYTKLFKKSGISKKAKYKKK